MLSTPPSYPPLLQVFVLLSLALTLAPATTVAAEIDSASDTVESIFDSARGVKVGGSILAVLAIAAGAIVCLAGYKLFRAALFVVGFVAGGVGLAIAAEHIFKDETWVVTASWIAFVVGGVLVGCLVISLYTTSIFVAGAAAGVLLAIMINTDLKQFAEQDANGDWVYAIPTAWWAYVAGILVLFVIGMVVQFRKTGRGDDCHRSHALPSRREPVMLMMRTLRIAATAALAVFACGANAAIQADTAANATSVNADTVGDILSAAGNVTELPGGNALCDASAARVRRPWGALSEDDQALYLEAVALAVENGALKQFADLYADEASGAQAAYSSAFFLWHRRLVLGFESYLRGLAPKFACLTVPYYDVHTAYVRAATRECSSLYECSGIFKAFGGEPTTKASSLRLSGRNVSGVLHTGYPFAADCDDDDVCGEHVRNDLRQTAVPPSAGFAAFQRLVASSSDYASFLEGVQFGLHSEVRDAVGGALATAAAPRDAFFYSWHAALDMLLHTYQLCRVGVPLSESDFKNSTLTFPSDGEAAGGLAGAAADSKLLFNVRVNGSAVDIAEHPALGPYFSYVGNELWHYGDVQQLGDYSYTYELPEVLRQQLLTNADVCSGFSRAFAATANVTRTLASKNITTKSTLVTTTRTVTTTVVRNGTKYTTTTTTKTTVRRNATTTTTARNTTSSLASFFANLTARFGYLYDLSDDDTYVEGADVTNGYVGYKAYAATGGVLTTKHSGIVVADLGAGATTTTTTTTAKNTTTKYATKSEATYRNVTTVRANVTVNGVAAQRNVTASVATTGAYWLWLQTAYDGLKERFEGNVDLVAQHLHLLELRAYEGVFGRVANFSASFVQNAHLSSARSVAGQVLDDIQAGKYELAAASANFSARSVTFVNTTVIRRLVTTYKRTITRRNVTYLTATYVQAAEAAVKKATAVLLTAEATKKNSTTTTTTTGNATTTVVSGGGVTITGNKTTTVTGDGQEDTTTTTVIAAPAATSKTSQAPAATPAATSKTSQVPAATPAASSVKPAATPAASTVKPAATPAASTVKPAATPAASTVKPAATPAASTVIPAATPAASTVKPAVTPAASAVKPAVTPAASAVKPAVTPAASTPAPTNIIKVVVTPAPTSPKLIC
ncbi:hypothetical protein PybrP1_011833 [[Pythium] brassicae (nom. inval.)]|nr:hypothetical protein PybrP1_011833 [[Pythium] brassicae (nom. inval.)]